MKYILIGLQVILGLVAYICGIIFVVSTTGAFHVLDSEQLDPFIYVGVACAIVSSLIESLKKK